ncbi:unnamed protein product [Timema podura]|uniref:Uncharacterized protein n=1 Tax=Timema podura TaxID=61482 RepID=A0ABN7P2R6_TIMPD|nr:unnamed protein product [Timema podura]
MIRQRIVSKILKTYSKTLYDNPPAVLKFLDIILCKEVKTVELNDQNLRYDSEIWPILLKRCTGLERNSYQNLKYSLNLVSMAQVMSVLNRFAMVPKMLGPCGAGTLQPLLCRLCLNCPQLTELVLKDSVKGSDTMAFIGKTCHRLRLLDITGSRVVCSDLIRLCVRSPHRALQDFTANSTENSYLADVVHHCGINVLSEFREL